MVAAVPATILPPVLVEGLGEPTSRLASVSVISSPVATFASPNQRSRPLRRQLSAVEGLLAASLAESCLVPGGVLSWWWSADALAARGGLFRTFDSEVSCPLGQSSSSQLPQLGALAPDHCRYLICPQSGGGLLGLLRPWLRHRRLTGHFSL